MTDAMTSLCLGGLASMVAGLVTHPVDTCKVRLQNSLQAEYTNMLQTAGKVVRQEGFQALYKGLGAALLREGSYSTLRLGLYEPYKKMLGYPDRHNCPVWVKLLGGLLSGGTGSVVSTPMDLVKVRLQSRQGPGSLLGEVGHVLAQEGVRGLWKGGMVNITRGAVLTATKMATYDSVKHTLLRRGFSDDMPTFFACSLITGMVLTVVTAPLDLVKTRLMSGHGESVGQIVRGVFGQEGKRVFFRAMGPQFIRFGPFNIIQLVLWEELKRRQGLATL